MAHSPETSRQSEWPGTDPAELLNEEELEMLARFLAKAGEKDRAGHDFLHASYFRLAHRTPDQAHTKGYEGRGYAIGRVQGTDNDFGNEVAILCEDGRIRVTRERALRADPKSKGIPPARLSSVPKLARNIVGRNWVGNRFLGGIVSGDEDYDTLPDGARFIPGTFSGKTNGTSFTPREIGYVLANHLGTNDSERYAGLDYIVETTHPKHPTPSVNTAAVQRAERLERERQATELVRNVDATWEAAIRYTKGEYRSGDDKTVPFERMSPESLASRVVLPLLQLDIKIAEKHGVSARDFVQLAPRAKEAIIGHEAGDAALEIATRLHAKLQAEGLVSNVYVKDEGYAVTGSPEAFDAALERVELGKLGRQHEWALSYLTGDLDYEVGHNGKKVPRYASLKELEELFARRSGLYLKHFDRSMPPVRWPAPPSPDKFRDQQQLRVDAKIHEEIQEAVDEKFREAQKMAMQQARKDIREVARQHFELLETGNYIEADASLSSHRLVLAGSADLREEIAKLRSGEITPAVHELLRIRLAAETAAAAEAARKAAEAAAEAEARKAAASKD